jgi:hypothetical protein
MPGSRSVVETTLDARTRAVGREGELAVLDAFLEPGMTPRELVLTGVDLGADE